MFQSPGNLKTPQRSEQFSESRFGKVGDKVMQRLFKKGAAFDMERKRRVALYGMKADSHVFGRSVPTVMNGQFAKEKKGKQRDKDDQDSKATWQEALIIKYDNPFKAMFDVFILFLVLYSCITSMFNSVFDAD